MFRILVDGSADMPKEWEKDYQLSILPMPIQIGNKTYYQGEDLSPSLFYELTEAEENHPQSAAPSPAHIQAFIEKISDVGDTILSLTVSGKMSSTISMVRFAANALKEKILVIPFDSQAGSAALAFMAREARLMEQAGETIDDILVALSNLRDKIMIVLTVDDLEYAHRSGRVNRLTKALTSLLDIKPIIKLQEGALSMASVTRTRKKSLEKLVSLVKERFDGIKIKVAVVHSQDKETAEILKNMVEKALACSEIILTDLSLAVAANLGPKTVGLVALPEKI
jgi:DegV family protein with EDD domain